jgi:hypothetical protein
MRLMRKLHEWFGLITALIVVIVSVTGVLLVHKKTLGLDKFAISLPGYSVPALADASDIVQVGEHLLVNTKQGVFVQVDGEWRGILPVQTRQLIRQDGFVYICAKNGLYRSNDGLTWQNLMPGQDVRTLYFSSTGMISVTEKGVFRHQEESWTQIASFGKKPLDVRKVLATKDGYLLAAKEGIFSVAAEGKLNAISLPIPETGATPVSLQRIITDLHNGEFFGRLGYLAIDATGIGLVLLSLTGAYIWYLPWKKRRLIQRMRGVSVQ